MPSSNTPYTVTGDLDKIQQHPSLSSFDWQPVFAPRPNRVIARFSDKEAAQNLFDDMKTAGLEAWKNWL